MSRVIPIEAWPRRSDTTLGWIPFSSINVAWAWRRSWNRTWGNPASLRTRRHAEDRVSGLSGEPWPESTTRPHSRHLSGAAARRVAWAARWRVRWAQELREHHRPPRPPGLGRLERQLPRA